ncbi:MAG TPA: acyltransferase domain-containing protein, partial [Streptosporangiaceae bacterium]
VIRQALANARVSASEVDAVEAHGTGTRLGDPIEAQALIATYGQDRPGDRPVLLGSVKSNIGHAQAAGGVAGVMKMVLALQHGLLPATLHVDEPSPHVDWSAGSVRLLTEPVAWAANGHPRRAGVSAFGVSGTNVHAIVEEAPAGEAAGDPAAEPGGPVAGPPSAPVVPAVPVLAGGVTVWLVSGRGAAGLAGQAARLREFVVARPGLGAADVGWSLATTRSVFEHRAVVLGAAPEGRAGGLEAGRDGLLAGLAALAAGEPAAGLVSGVVPAGGTGRVVFVFPGQGSQWLGMGRELAESSPVFAARLAECGQALAPFVDWSLNEVLAGAPGAPALEAASVVQPVLWAIMVSLAAVWQAAGVVPDAVVGHSQGEIAAACVAGVLSLEDAAKVVALRSRALGVLAGHGGMLSVAGPAAVVAERIAGFGERISVAAVNGPAATVVAGEPQALEDLAARCAAAGVRTRMIAVDYASHTAQVEAIREEILNALAGITAQAAQVPMVSAMTGQLIDGPGLDAGYWYDSLRAPVQFTSALATLAEDGHRAFLEISPHPVLTAAITETLDELNIAVLATGTLRRDDGGAIRLLSSLAEAHVHGITVDWAAVLPAGQRVDLPTYAFQRQKYWLDAVAGNGAPVGGDGAGTAAEARFWAAVEDGDLPALAETLAVEDPERLGAALPALAAWRRTVRERSDTESWRYRVAWSPFSDPGPAVLTGTWLLAVPAGTAGLELAGRCAQELGRCGAQVVRVDAGPGLSRPGLAGQLGEFTAPIAGVLSLLALADDHPAGGPAVPAGLAGTLMLIQALGDAGIGAPLWVLTHGAVAAGPAEAVIRPAQSQVWGLGRVAAAEYPDRWGGLVDLPPVMDQRAGARLASVLAGCGEDEVAIRPGAALARRLLRAPLPRLNGHRWTPHGTVLVTGGTGAAGRHLARWLASRGAPRIVLASRSGPAAPGVPALAADLAAAGAPVAVMMTDLAERPQVSGLLDWIDGNGRPLSSVLHTAVALDDGVLDGLDAGRLAGVLAAKATGAAHLDELTAGRELDAFVLFSSTADTFGSAGQGNYAAANAFLDAVAQNRVARGQAALSVAWGQWGGGGLAQSTEAVRQRLRRGALPPMDPRLAVQALGQALDCGDHTLAIMDVDWPAFAAAPGAAQLPFLRDLPEIQAAVPVAAAPAESGELAQRLATRPAAERSQFVADLVRAEAAAILGHSSPTSIDPGRAFRDFGFDSLTSVELRNRLTTISGLRLPSTLVFDHPTPVAVAEFLLGELTGVPAGDAPVAVTGPVDEPVAVVAMGCRYPGGVRGPDDLWDLIAAGTDAIAGFPLDRGWDAGSLSDPGSGQPGSSYARAGGFVYDAGDFDAGFFGISPREALAMDPQQRLLLEVSWEAIERAGIDPGSLRGSSAGVFAGASFSGYGAGLPEGTGGAEGYLLTGTAGSVISGRVAYTLGLEGPAVTVDTACSSSLVALHLACQ